MTEENFVTRARKSRWTLNQGQVQLLTDWMRGDAGLRLARRAWFILSEHEGLPVHRYFQATPVPSRRIQALVQKFDLLGPFALIDRPRAGRPSHSRTSWSARRTAAGEHFALVRNVTLDGGRKRLRSLSLKIPTMSFAARILALALDHEVLIVVIQTQASRRRDLPMIGQCITLGEHSFASQAFDKTTMDWRDYLIKLASPVAQQLGARVSAEQRRPFVEILKRLVGDCGGVRLYFVAPAKSSRLLSWMSVFAEYFDSPDLNALLRAAHFSCDVAEYAGSLGQLFDAELVPLFAQMLQKATGTFYWVRSAETSGEP